MHYDIAKFLRPAIVAVGMSAALCAVPEFAIADDREPIAFVGHGAFFDHNGKQIVPTPEFLASALAWYRAKLLSQLGREKRSEFEAKERQAREGLQLEGQSRLVFDARMIDWLLANTEELKLDPPVEPDPKRPESRFTHRVRHDRTSSPASSL